MRNWWIALSVLFLASCSAALPAQSSGSEPKPATATPATVAASTATPAATATAVSWLPNLGPVPELTNQVWLNTDQALRLADLRGKVVLLDMWTFG